MQTPLIVLAIIDGFGYAEAGDGNAISSTPTPNLDYLWSHFPHFLVRASEEEVGLAFGEVGNSEVGHVAIGTGRVVPQNLARINRAVEDGTFYQNEAFLKAIDHVQKSGGDLHITGIISTPGVHGHLDHIIRLLDLASQHKLNNVYLHLITDGRDSGPKDTPLYLQKIEQTIAKTKTGTIASIIGRAFAMDRNNNWERIQKTYQMLLGHAENTFPTIKQALDTYYQTLDDENIPPTLIVPPGKSPAKLKDGDALIFTNYREDRARQLTKALVVPGPEAASTSKHTFDHFPRLNHPDILMVSMTQYEHGLPTEVAFPPPEVKNSLSDILAANSIPQIHIAETEKYAHVTYFFNGGRETKAPGEEFFMVPSVKPEEFVARPEMSADGITNSVIQSIDLGYRFIVLNYANCDMIGHTGNFEATQKAITTVDNCFKRLWDKVYQVGGYLLITADHGNSEMMKNPKTGDIYKEHTISSVPFVIAHLNLYQEGLIQKVTTNAVEAGLLSDVAPTILSLLKIEQPPEMTGTSLLEL